MEPRFLGSAFSKKDMVSLSQRESISLHANADKELRAFYSFVFGESVDLTTADDIPHLNLLRAISNRDKKGFHEEISDLEKRQINEESVWVENDSLIFLILVGSEIFDLKSELIEKVLVAREKNTNPSARRVNQVFRALSRKEYGMEGEYSFIKIVFLQLSGKLTLTNETARQPYLTLIRPGLLDELSPFLQVLAIRAFDLILFNRAPKKFEDYPAILEGIEGLHDELSLRQAIRLLFGLPAKAWISVLSVFFTLLLCAFGIGQKSSQWSLITKGQIRTPNSLSVTSISNAAQAHSRLLKDLSTSLLLSRQAAPGNHFVGLVVESSEFETSTPTFYVESSHVGSPIVDGYAFIVNDLSEPEVFRVIPTQNTATGLRSLVPESNARTKIVFLVLLEVPAGQAPSDHHFTIRSYD
jgi:hypothetical protein